MKPRRFLLFLLLLCLFIVLHPPSVQAGKNEFITVVNPVRISAYILDPKESVQAQYSVILENNLHATWLLTYDALVNQGTMAVVRSMNEDQEVGLAAERGLILEI